MSKKSYKRIKSYYKPKKPSTIKKYVQKFFPTGEREGRGTIRDWAGNVLKRDTEYTQLERKKISFQRNKKKVNIPILDFGELTFTNEEGDKEAFAPAAEQAVFGPAYPSDKKDIEDRQRIALYQVFEIARKYLNLMEHRIVKMFHEKSGTVGEPKALKAVARLLRRSTKTAGERLDEIHKKLGENLQFRKDIRHFTIFRMGEERFMHIFHDWDKKTFDLDHHKR